MVQVQHISFKDWNPIGKPRKKTHGNSGDSSSSVKDGTLNEAGLNRKNSTENKDPFGEPLEGVNKIAKTIENKGFSRKGKADGKNFVRWKPLHILERCKEKRQGKTAVRHGLGIVFKL